ncbi:unnamed protein product [Lupinus luteus]|uniref:Uncharacterized protein n=1 Tax=Lupinus luteus TaxID=3873 RepID=A0AAV1WLG1_LUPLU
MGVNFQANPISSISILCSIILMLTFFTTPSLSFNKGPYDLFKQFNFPKGILPRGATNYTFDNSTGNFTINLEKPCNYKIQSFEWRFKSTITGIITKDNITSFEGLQVKVVFWISITKLTNTEKGIVTFYAGNIPLIVPTILLKVSPLCL